MEKTFIKFDDIEIEKQKFNQHKRPISIKIQMLIKQQYVIRSLFVKKRPYWLQRCKKLDLYVYFCQQRVHIEDPLMKINKCLMYIHCLNKRQQIIEKIERNLGEC